MRVKKERFFRICDGEPRKGSVVYWMSRDQRAQNNDALIYAQDLALDAGLPLVVVFCLVPQFLGANLRQYGFMLRGLEETVDELLGKKIGFALLRGPAEVEVPRFVHEVNAALLITDFDPLLIKRKWRSKVAEKLPVPFYEVDAHNIVPCRFVSGKREFAARTLRPKIEKLLDDFLDGLRVLKAHPFAPPAGTDESIDTDRLLRGMKIDRSIGEVDWLAPGRKSARRLLKRFIERGLTGYKENSNDPNTGAESNLSPYLHFGQISAMEIALAVRSAQAPVSDKDAFLEQLIVRKELSDNFCHYSDDYTDISSFPDWALKTLREHKNDKRQYLYSRDQFENAATHDRLWNAAQREMVERGKMHGFMRMYWAKKILEWTNSPAEAMETALYLNDRYELDGRDPNGYVGVAWAIAGVHDRAWTERSVFGKIRYMNYNGCRRKFDVEEYINSVSPH